MGIGSGAPAIRVAATANADVMWLATWRSRKFGTFINRGLLVAWLMINSLITGCGGGGGDSAAQSPTSAQTGSANVVALELSPPVPERVKPGQTYQHQVIAIDSQGNRRDVTSSVSFEVLDDTRLSVIRADGPLSVTVKYRVGPTQLRVRFGNQQLDQVYWSSQVADLQVSRLRITVADDFSPMVPLYGTDRYGTTPGHILAFQVLAQHAGGETDITGEVSLISSDPAIMTVEARYSDAEQLNLTRYRGFAFASGTADISARFASLVATQRVQVAPALVLAGDRVEAHGITESAAGRITGYFLADTSETDTPNLQTGFAESSAANRWSPYVLLASPVDRPAQASHVWAGESPSGYRSIATTTSLGRMWVHLVSPDGAVSGPIESSQFGEVFGAVHVVVDFDGGTHLWVEDAVQIRRLFIDRSTRTVTTRSILAKPDSYGNVHVKVSSEGHVGAAWRGPSCRIYYLHDHLASTASLTAASINSIDLPNCQSDLGISEIALAVGPDEMAVALKYATGFLSADIRLVTLPTAGNPAQYLLEQDEGGFALAGGPAIGAAPDGAMVVLWARSDRSVRASYRQALEAPRMAFVVEPPFFTLATPAVQGVYPRGDDRFLLAWRGGQAGVRDVIEFRDYSVASGPSVRSSLGYQVWGATDQTFLTASVRGVSAVWSYFQDDGTQVWTALQSFTP